MYWHKNPFILLFDPGFRILMNKTKNTVIQCSKTSVSQESASRDL